MTWHCFGLGDIASGMGMFRGYCVGTDPTEIKSLSILPVRKFPVGPKTWWEVHVHDGHREVCRDQRWCYIYVSRARVPDGG